MSATVSSYIPTAGASDTRAKDDLSLTVGARPQALTAYVRLLEIGNAVLANAGRVFRLGTNGAPSFELRIHTNGRYLVAHANAASNVTATVTTSPSVGDLVELLAVLNADGSVQLTQAINGGAPEVGTASGTLTLAEKWSNTTLTVNANGSANVGMLALNRFHLRRGIATLQQCRRRVGLA